MNVPLYLTAVASFVLLAQATERSDSAYFDAWDKLLFEDACKRPSFVAVRRVCEKISPIFGTSNIPYSITVSVERTQLTLCEDVVAAVVDGTKVLIPEFHETKTCAVTFFQQTDSSTSNVNEVMSLFCTFERPFGEQTQLKIQAVEAKGNFLLEAIAPDGTGNFKLSFSKRPFIFVVKANVNSVTSSTSPGYCVFRTL